MAVLHEVIQKIQDVGHEDDLLWVGNGLVEPLDPWPIQGLGCGAQVVARYGMPAVVLGRMAHALRAVVAGEAVVKAILSLHVTDVEFARAQEMDDFHEDVTERASFGTGFRVPYVFSEDMHLCASAPGSTRGRT